MATRTPARLIVALSVAAVLAIFLVYSAVAGSGVPQLAPGELAARQGERVSLVGVVRKPVSGDAQKDGLRFVVREIGGTSEVTVLYKGSVPDLFRVDRHVVVDGRLSEDGTFVAVPDTLVTKCPSKYQAADA